MNVQKVTRYLIAGAAVFVVACIAAAIKHRENAVAILASAGANALSSAMIVIVAIAAVGLILTPLIRRR